RLGVDSIPRTGDSVLVILLEAQRRFVVAHRSELPADVVDHLLEPANVGVEPALAGKVPGDLFLHVPGVAGPAWVRTAEGGNKMEPGILARHLFELVAVADVGFVAHAERQ